MQVTGTGNCKHFRAGYTFSLKDHFNADLNQEYLITEVRENASQGIKVEGGAIVGGNAGTYQMTFVAIPTTVNDQEIFFRPKRITSKPVVPGLINGKIDDSSSGDYAELDENGSYKCRTFSDLSGTEDGKGSRFVRQAQDYAGAGMGSHYPAHKGTEVAFVCTEGDPNRPMILGQVPNAETLGPVSAGNQTQCKTVTGGGNSMTIEDTDGGQRIVLYSPHSGTTFSMGAPLE